MTRISDYESEDDTYPAKSDTNKKRAIQRMTRIFDYESEDHTYPAKSDTNL